MKDNKREINWAMYSEEKRELHDYYLSLGYDERTAAVLALFTFGDGGRRGAVRIDRLYEELLGRGSADHDDDPMPRSFRYAAPASAPQRTGSASAPMRTGPSGPAQGRKLFMDSCAAPMPKNVSRSRTLSALSSIGESMSKGIRSRRSYLSEASSFADSITSGEESLLGGMFSGAYANSARVMPATDEYEPIEEKGFRNVADQMTSTFRMTTNTASAGILFNQLREDRRIDRSMVRIEEMLAYFRYKSVLPDAGKFRISCELMPVAERRKLLYINVQGKEEVKQGQNIVLLLDVSGSMSSNTVQVQAMVATILSKLKEGDKISLVTYSTRDEVVLNGMEIRSEEDRIRALEKLEASGGDKENRLADFYGALMNSSEQSRSDSDAAE